MKKMGVIIRDMVTKSFGDQDYDRAVEHIGVMREAATELEFPDLFNSFMKDFKTRILSGEFGGDRRELWWQIKHVKLGLIDTNASEHSKVTTEEAVEVSILFGRSCHEHIADVDMLVSEEVVNVM